MTRRQLAIISACATYRRCAGSTLAEACTIGAENHALPEETTVS